jgi:hypothetical protein
LVAAVMQDRRRGRVTRLAMHETSQASVTVRARKPSARAIHLSNAGSETDGRGVEVTE